MTEPWIDFAELRRRARFEPVLARYGLTLVGKGSQRSLRCPFHDEKKPSCKINLERKVFHCFGCDAKGNILDFVARMEHASVTAAARTLATICNIPLAEVSKEIEQPTTDRTATHRRPGKPQDAREAPPTRETTSPTETAHGEPPVPPERPINPPLSFTLKLDPAHPYLAERNVSPEVAQTFGLGYCARGMMKGRIAIPIHDAEGQLIAYAGRWPGNEGWPEGEDRYKLPQGFEKSRILFNLNRVKDVDHVTVVEGFFSVFRLFELGYENVVALMGRSLSERQEELLTARFSRLTLLFDGDAPGRGGAAAILPRLARRLFVREAVLPDGAQPDSVAEPLLRELLHSAAR